MSLKISIRKILNWFGRSTENSMKNIRKIKQEIPTAKLKADEFVPQSDKYDPAKVAFEHLKTSESKEFRAVVGDDIDRLIAKRQAQQGN